MFTNDDDPAAVLATTPSSTRTPTLSRSTPKTPTNKRRKLDPPSVNLLHEPPTSTVLASAAIGSTEESKVPPRDADVEKPTIATKVVKKRLPKMAKEPTPEPTLEDYQPRVQNEWKIGAHVSAAGGLENAVRNAASIGANAFALFLKSNRKWENPPLTETSIKRFRSRLTALQYESSLILPHATYLINLGHPITENREKGYRAFVDELRRCEQLGLTLLNFHPGGTVGQISKEECIRNIAACLNRAHREVTIVVTVIECMAGHKNVVGCDMRDLADIIALVDDKSRVGVCLDTCHMFSAGYDLRTKEEYEKTMISFDSIVGFSYLKGMHLNDSKVPFGSRKDQHENIGVGSIGLMSFGHILSDIRVKNLPLILETPGFDCQTVWSKEIEILNGVSLKMQAGEQVEEGEMLDGIKAAIKETEANGWSAKGKTKKTDDKIKTGARTGKKGKRKAMDVDGDDASVDRDSSLTVPSD
ncbi:hypothetical protein FRB96_006631 [Tulasnella sp. 330]|nr:hypothetical protein FRB96_006631 [Tulasnella sp. 330]KAG8879371.1 hypothetical protein FRB98_005689 [Tulasnella sp. 332]KAG8881331.1 hypothetical protein FRB97_009673 [Tulasnella sp. 331]